MSRSKRALVLAETVKHWMDLFLTPARKVLPPTVERLEERRLFSVTWDSSTVATATSTSAQTAGSPVDLSTGALVLNTSDIEANGFGSAWGITRSWTNNEGLQMPGSSVGNGWDINENPQIVIPPGTTDLFEIITSGSSADWFQSSGGGSPTFTPYFGNYDQLAYSSGEYTLTDQSGNQTVFYGSSYGAYSYTLDSYIPASGAEIHVTSHNTAGSITEEDRSEEDAGGNTTTEALDFTYFSSGELEKVVLSRSSLALGTVAIRQVEYSYYGDGTGDTSFGDTNDLRTAKVEDGAGNLISEDYYRYFNGSGGGDLLHYVFNGPAFARMPATFPDTDAIFVAPDSDVNPYATLQLSYGSGETLAAGIPSNTNTAYSQTYYPISHEWVAGDGTSLDGLTGIGEYSFAYETNSSFSGGINSGPPGMPYLPDDSGSTSAQFNQIAYQTVVTTPAGLTETYDLNYAGETIVEESIATSGTGPRYTDDVYNAVGLIYQQYDSLAINSIDMSTGVVTLASTGGELTQYDYSTATSATSSSAGSASGYLQSETVQPAQGGTPETLETVDYKSQTVGGISIYYVADDTVYQDTAGSVVQTTQYQYNYTSGTFSPTSLLTTFPSGSAAYNGVASSYTDEKVYDADGNTTWEIDRNGNIVYQAFDFTTGSVTQKIADVTLNDYSSYNSSDGGLAPFTVPASDGLALVTSYENDAEGRVTKKTTADGNVTLTFYNDSSHTMTVYPGWTEISGNYNTTGPVTVTHDDWSAGYNETFTYAYTPSTSSTPTDVGSAPGSLLTLSRTLTNYSGQSTEKDAYFNVSSSGFAYSETYVQLGSAGTNYYPTHYYYDSDGNMSQVNESTGTITFTTFDQFDEQISVSVGTSIVSTTVSKSAYDLDGDLIENVSYPGGTADGRATVYSYNFREQLISKMVGAVESAGVIGSPVADTSSDDTFVTDYTVDNLGEETEADTYNTNGSTSSLTAVAEASYDNLGRMFSSTIVSVDPMTHTEGTADKTNYYYDGDGNLIAKIGPTGGATKYAFNGADWNTFTYVTDGGTINNAANISNGSSTAYNSANGVFGDVVLNQIQNVYDNDGNIIETINSDRFGTDSSVNGTPTGYVATGALGNLAGTGGPASRVSYAANYYDAIDRLTASANFGTYGGATFSLSSFTSVPTSSATVLVNSTIYNAAGWVDSTIDPKNLVTKYAYDALGRTVQTVADYTDGTPTNSSNQTTDYTYDGDNHVTSMTAIVPGSYNQTTGYMYGVTSGIDDNDLLYKIEYPSPSTGLPSGSSQDEIYGYDALGEVTSYVDRNSTTHSYTYDHLGRLTSDSVSAGSGVDTAVTQLAYGYNTAGQLSTLTSYNGSTVLNAVVDSYDGFGQLATDAQSHAGNVSGGTPTVSYGYSAANDDRPISITYPDGRGIAYNYSGGSGLDSAVDRISLVANVSGGNLQSYTYLGLDTPVTFSDGNGVQLSYLGTIGGTSGDAGDQYTGLDRFGRIINQNWSTTSQGVDQFSYGYDQDSNVTYQDVTTATSNTSTNTALALLSQVYSYDGLNRLTNASTGTISSITGSTATIGSPSSSEGWVLDAVGNWNSSTSTVSGSTTTTSRTNNAQNQVVTVGSTTLTYDSNGNTLTDQSGQAYVYDAWNRLVKVTGVNGTVLAQYSYDAEGRQITETHGSVTTNLYYSNRWQVVQENVGSLVTAEHVWSPFYVDAMIQTVTNPQVTANQSNGTVDSGFGMNTSNHTTTTTLSSTPTAAVSAADGSDIVVGIVAGTTPELLFYNASGLLDTAFGSGSGTVSLSSVNATSIAGMLVQSNGKIDLAIQNSSGGMTVVQLNADGSLDTGFNGSGVQTLSGLPGASGLVMARNGDLLVAGVSGTSVVSAELSPSDGSLITGYNSSGVSSVSMGGSWTSLTFLSMAEAPDGDLVVAGDAAYYSDGTLTNDAVLMAVRADGSSFGGFGIVNAGLLTLAPGYSAVAISPAGQIYFGVATGTTSVVLKAIEFNCDGSVDTAFGTGGTASTGTISGDGSGLILQIQLNGEIVIGAGGSGSSGHFIVARFNPNGTKDTSFGSSGIKIGVAEGGGLSMVMAANGETIIIGKAPSGSTGMILEEFGTLATTQTYYVEYDADYNTTSVTNSSGGVVERYTYDPYGNVKVLTAAGATNGKGSAANSYVGFVYLHQGLRLDVLTSNCDSRNRAYNLAMGRFNQQDPIEYLNGPNRYQLELSSSLNYLDPSGCFALNILDYAPVAAGVSRSVAIRAVLDFGANLTGAVIIGVGLGVIADHEFNISNRLGPEMGNIYARLTAVTPLKDPYPVNVLPYAPNPINRIVTWAQSW